MRQNATCSIAMHHLRLIALIPRETGVETSIKRTRVLRLDRSLTLPPIICRMLVVLMFCLAIVGCSGDAATQGKVTIPDAKVFSKTKTTQSPPARAPSQ
jgi:hypothetical protein